jgi:hypothetical protein
MKKAALAPSHASVVAIAIAAKSPNGEARERFVAAVVLERTGEKVTAWGPCRARPCAMVRDG